MMKKRDLVIIGGGAGGLVVASVAAQLGLDVVLVEKQQQLGGDCLHYGCVPSKALLKAAHVAQTLRKADTYGFQACTPVTDMAAVRASVHDAINTIQKHDSHERFESLGCEIITGEAVFIDAHTICAGETTISARRFVIATGSSPWVPAIKGLEKVDFMTNEDVFQLEKLPQQLLILGAGPVGVEMAQAFARLGSAVRLVEKDARILPLLDADIAETLTQVLLSEGVEIITGNAVTSVDSIEDGICVNTQDGAQLCGDSLLVAMGRRAVVGGLGLEKAGVEYSERGISVNARMQTTRKHIYACGDVTGLHPFTHVAEQQAGVVIANAIFRIPKRMNYDVLPSVVYTEPECAQVGIAAPAANDAGKLEIARFDMADLDRAVAEHTTEGFAKLVVKNGKLLGAHIIGPRAGDVIHELALAMQAKMKLSAITGMMHAYPSYAQINRRAASQYYRDRLFSSSTRKLVGFLNKWLP